MNLRRATSLTALISFLVLVLNSVVLYVVPEGRVAYWADWHLWGLTKPDWGAQHVVVGCLFLAAMGLHICYNGRVLLVYLKNRARKVKVFTAEFNLAVALTAVCVAGAQAPFPPFSWLLDLSAQFKDAAEATYGAPPYGHAELSSLQTLAKRTDLDLAASLDRLRAAGVTFESAEQTVQEVAKANGLPPSRVYQAMVPPAPRGGPVPMPAAPVSGTGKKTIRQLCETYGLDLSAALRHLADKHIPATPEMTLKEVGAASGRAPDEVYAVLRETAPGAPAE
ncbi:MAG: DUF4405 domain-containing protein [Deferrisomatales bacterium]|nr:DUF4405 domain-containing protein [Deferrisomatales bacterium]